MRQHGCAVVTTEALHHAMYAGNVVVGGADELEQALHRILPQHSGTCTQLQVISATAA